MCVYCIDIFRFYSLPECSFSVFYSDLRFLFSNDVHVRASPYRYAGASVDCVAVVFVFSGLPSHSIFNANEQSAHHTAHTIIICFAVCTPLHYHIIHLSRSLLLLSLSTSHIYRKHTPARVCGSPLFACVSRARHFLYVATQHASYAPI